MNEVVLAITAGARAKDVDVEAFLPEYWGLVHLSFESVSTVDILE